MSDTMRLDAIHPFVLDKAFEDDLLNTPLQDAALARIGGLENMFEAEMIRDALTKEGIFCLLQSNRETAFTGLFIPQKSWGSLIVRMDQAEQALGVVRVIRSSFESGAAQDEEAEVDSSTDSSGG